MSRLTPLLAILPMMMPAAAHAVCRVDVRPLVFGSIDLTRTSYGKGAIVVSCDQPTRFEVAIGGRGGDGRKMRGGSGRRLVYRLFRDPSYSVEWGDGGGGGATVHAVSDGERPTRLTVYGAIPAQPGVPGGAYMAQMTVTLRY